MPETSHENRRDRLTVIDDEKKRAIDFWDTGIEVPQVGIFEEPTRCYKINLQWAKVVMGMVSWLTEIAAWHDAQNEAYIAITEISKFLKGSNCEMPYQLRQNPENSCLIEQSSDGVVWTTAFDLSLCMSIVDGSSQTSIEQNFTVTNYQTFQDFVYNNYVNNYINNITDLQPELGYDGSTLDDFRDLALCYALTRFVDSVADAAIKYFDEVDETASDLKTTLALTVAIVGIIAIAATGIGAIGLAGAATLWGAGIGLGSALGATLVDKWSNENRAVYESQQNREDVLCCLLDQLKSANLNQADFQQITDDGCFLSAEAHSFFTSLIIFAQQDATYAAMVENLRIGLNSAKLGILPSCLCDSGFTLLDFDFSDDKYYWNETEFVTWEGDYFAAKELDPDPDNQSIQWCIIDRFFSDSDARVFAVGFIGDNNRDCGTPAASVQCSVDGVNTGGFSVSPPPTGNDYHIVWSRNDTNLYFAADKIRVRCDGHLCNGLPVNGKIKHVRVWLHPTSPIKGTPTTLVPTGIPANGSSSLAWWA